MGFLNFSRRADRAPKAPAGYRAYAVGDIHGRRDLLDQLLSKIESDLSERPAAKTLIAFLGDYIDRGPHSAQVIERLISYRLNKTEIVFLLGNHEEVLLRILAGDNSLVSSWLRFGGLECLESYGVDRAEVRHKSAARIAEIVRRVIPVRHIKFLKGCIDTCRFGDYLFVHAGIRPGLEVQEQSQADLRWIREPFLSDATDHGFLVVHGHTISPEVEQHPNRIAIDTGAYRTGVLTALALEGRDRWWLDTRTPSRPPSVDLGELAS